MIVVVPGAAVYPTSRIATCEFRISDRARHRFQTVDTLSGLHAAEYNAPQLGELLAELILTQRSEFWK